MYANLLRVCLIILSLSVACLGKATGEDAATPTQSTSSKPTLSVQPANGERVFVDNMAEIKEAVPFDIIIPENLPLDLQLSLVSVQLPPDSLDKKAKDQNTRLLLAFGNKDETAGFQLFESLSAPGISPSGVRSISHGDTIVDVEVNEERKYVAATWEGCSIGFLLTGGPPERLTKANLLIIVDATLQACE